MDRRDSDRYKVLTRRAILVSGAQIGLIGALVGRLYYLEVVEASKYKLLARDNSIGVRFIVPVRGRIFDRFGADVATNKRNYRVLLLPEQADNVGTTLDKLAEIIPIDAEKRRDIEQQIEKRDSFIPVTVANHLTWNQFARVNVLIPSLPGVQLGVGLTRHYPMGDELAHILGYVGAPTEKNVRNDPLLELPGFQVGKNGIEKHYDLALRGKAGYRRVEVNAMGREVRELQRNNGTPGLNINLTIDARLQSFLSQRLAAHRIATGVVLDVTTGDILAMASTPSYDPNDFVLGITNTEWHQLNSDHRHPLNDLAVTGQFPPGSTFKPVVALAGLECGAIQPSTEFFCPGYYRLGNAVFHCWKLGGHGWIDLEHAIEQSCDVYFYNVAHRTGVNNIAEMAHRFGFGHATGIDLPGEASGLIPTPAWKENTLGRPWEPGETLITGIGQGYVLVTPLQLAVMAARLSNGGFGVTPRLVRNPAVMAANDMPQAAANPTHNSLGLNRANVEVILSAMKLVTSSPYGTAYAQRITEPGFAMAGKTGTAQARHLKVRTIGLNRYKLVPWIERDHGLFICFAPEDSPRYAAAFVIEHGGESSRAAAIAHDVMLQTQILAPLARPAAAGLYGATERTS
jgi:penicillin-binding protein 2